MVLNIIDYLENVAMALSRACVLVMGSGEDGRASIIGGLPIVELL